MDDFATILIVGVGPLLIAQGGMETWVPAWLCYWSYVTAALGMLAIVVIFNPALTGLELLIIPAGLGWMIAAGIVLSRSEASE